ncbi:MAG: PRD domain-containing protein [Solobacterium sp.]|nr:PRD domain-containing protein [Solobacterium sp.]
MKVIRCINNNVAVCLDSSGKELVAFGKGIGFRKPPYEVPLGKLERTYYGVDSIYLSMINDIPKKILDISDETIDYARVVLDCELSSNIIFTLADHLNFCIERYRKHMNFTLPIVRDIEQLFEKEVSVGQFALKLIRERMNVFLPREEAAYVALHLINYEEKQKNTEPAEDAVIENVTGIIEKEYGIDISRDDFNYSRFVSHMNYLFKRGKHQELMKTDNGRIYQDLVRDYPKTHEVSVRVSEYLEQVMNISLTDEEKLYLMLHINRLCTREDCYR